jgi:hypothetical protein
MYIPLFSLFFPFTREITIFLFHSASINPVTMFRMSFLSIILKTSLPVRLNQRLANRVVPSDRSHALSMVKAIACRHDKTSFPGFQTRDCQPAVFQCSLRDAIPQLSSDDWRSPTSTSLFGKSVSFFYGIRLALIGQACQGK